MLRAGATRRDSSNGGAVTIQGRFYALALGAMVLDGEAAVGDVFLSGGLSLCHQDEADFGGGKQFSRQQRSSQSLCIWTPRQPFGRRSAQCAVMNSWTHQPA